MSARQIVNDAVISLNKAGIDLSLSHITTASGIPSTQSQSLSFLDQSIAEARRLTLYAGCNICSGKCRICRYETASVSSNHLESSFDHMIHSLTTEARLLSSHIPSIKKAEVNSLYIGGGTPALMTSHQLSTLLTNLSQYFQIDPDCEITCEGTPSVWTAEKIANFKDLGVTRFSMGIQRMDDAWLLEMNRRHTVKHVTSALTAFNASKVRYNVDLMCGFAGQTPQDIASDITQILSFNPPEITVYFYENRRQIDGRPLNILPSDPITSLEMWQTAREICTDAGYREGPEGWWLRSNQVIAQCWTDRWHDQIPLIGLGARGYTWSRLNQYTNLSMKPYLEAIKAGILPIDPSRIYRYTPDQATCRKMAYLLKYDLATPILSKSDLFNRLAATGLGKIKNNWFDLTPSGLVVIEEIMSSLLK